MGTKLPASAIQVGDVIWDARTIDPHPCVVIGKDGHYLYMRNCTSHQTDALELLEIKKEHKTGDGSWSGKDSYLVANADVITMELSVYTHDAVMNLPMQVPVGPAVVQRFQAPDGQHFFQYVQPTQIVLAPQVVPQFSTAVFNKVGTVKPDRMAELLDALNHAVV